MAHEHTQTHICFFSRSPLTAVLSSLWNLSVDVRFGLLGLGPTQSAPFYPAYRFKQFFFTAQLNFPALPELSWNHSGLICVEDHVTVLGKRCRSSPSKQKLTFSLLSGRCLRLSLCFLLTHWSEINPNADRRQVPAAAALGKAIYPAPRRNINERRV